MPQAAPPPTQAARLTGHGRSAIAVIGLSGPRAAAILSLCFHGATSAALLPTQIRYGQWRSSHADADQGQAGESVVVTPLATDHFEIHCHGGPAAIDNILRELESQGAQIVSHDQFRVADQPLLIREAEAVLCRCVTARTAAIAMDQVRGALADWAREALHGNAETGNAETREGRFSMLPLADQARALLEIAPTTTRLADPFRVVLLGAPNVGKSSLTNAILGYDRSITMDTAGTTRDVLRAETVIDGVPIQISDTAGIRESEHAIEREGVLRAAQEMKQADLVLRLSDPKTPWISVTESLASIRVMNKVDQLPPGTDRREGVHYLSALTGEGVALLIQRIADQFTSHFPDSGQPAALNDRQVTCLGKIAAAESEIDQNNGLRDLIGGK